MFMEKSGFLKTYHINDARLQKVTAIKDRAWKLYKVIIEKESRLAFPALMELIKGNLKALEEKGAIYQLVYIPGAHEPPAAEHGREIKKAINLSDKYCYLVDEDRILIVLDSDVRSYGHSSSEEEAMKESPFQNFAYTLKKLEKLLSTEAQKYED